METRIGLTGDVMLGRLVDERQQSRSPEAVWGSMYEHLRSCDALIINLECCISTSNEQWTRTRRVFHFRANPNWAIPALTRAGVDACALANNHILDFEVEALVDTLEELDQARIGRSGAGSSIDEALEPAIIEHTNGTIGIVSLTDNAPEYAAGNDAPGTAYIEIDVDSKQTRETVQDALNRVRSHDADLTITSLHWGPNMVERPPSHFQEFARWLVDIGVDVVHGHSAHVFQGIEVYAGKPILYDTGDFVDDYAVDERLHNDRSFLFELRLEETGISELRLIPTQIEDCTVNRAGARSAEWSRQRMRNLSQPFGTSFERHGDRLVIPLEP